MAWKNQSMIMKENPLFHKAAHKTVTFPVHYLEMNAIDFYNRIRYYPARLPTQKQLATAQELVDIIGGNGDIAAIDGLAFRLGPLFHDRVGKCRGNFDLQDGFQTAGKWMMLNG